MEDPRVAAARYRADRDGVPEESPTESRPAGSPASTRSPTAADRAAYVETAIQQAMRRGDFDDLPGYGKPLEGLGDHHDPDWWIRRKIQTEQLRGLGPPALTLRVEHAEFAQRVDALTRETEVREYVEDFNRRVIEARRQLLGGPPVVTPTHDVEIEVAGWRERREERRDAASARAEEDTKRRRRRLRRSPTQW